MHTVHSTNLSVEALERECPILHDEYRLLPDPGGGYGNPRERPLELLARDLRQGKVSRASAERDYGADMVEKALRI